jgi:glutathione synthase/RimK-type ligase-like ATP-grasp enzyme
MRLAIVAHRSTQTNDALVAAGAELGIHTAQLTPREALHSLRPTDVALGRLDVRETCDGIEDGMRELEKLAAAGVVVLNPPAALAATHDKLLTSRALRRSGLPHPHTWLIAEGLPAPVPELPVVLKPRHGSWGRGVTLCRTHEDVQEATRQLYSDNGVLAQELVPPLVSRLEAPSAKPTALGRGIGATASGARAWDARLVVAGGRVVGSARRIAAEGEWRTNVALGGHSVPFSAPPLARSLAILASDAVHADLVGVDLLPTKNGWVIAELNGAVDFREWYGEDVFVNAVIELLRVARDRRAAAA